MLLRGELSGKLAINVHGKKLNLVYPSAKVSSYVQFGGMLSTFLHRERRCHFSTKKKGIFLYLSCCVDYL